MQDYHVANIMDDFYFKNLIIDKNSTYRLLRTGCRRTIFLVVKSIQRNLPECSEYFKKYKIEVKTRGIFIRLHQDEKHVFQETLLGI